MNCDQLDLSPQFEHDYVALPPADDDAVMMDNFETVCPDLGADTEPHSMSEQMEDGSIVDQTAIHAAVRPEHQHAANAGMPMESGEMPDDGDGDGDGHTLHVGTEHDHVHDHDHDLNGQTDVAMSNGDDGLQHSIGDGLSGRSKLLNLSVDVLVRENPKSAALHLFSEQHGMDSPTTYSPVGTCSRYGRTRAVPNFARMVDPLAARGSPNGDGLRDVKSSPQGSMDEMNAKTAQAMVDAVRSIVARVGAPSSTVAAAAVNPNSDKYIGVRLKHSGFGAVIKKNHSEINLGMFESAEEAARAYDMAALLCQGERAKVNFSDSMELYEANYTPDLQLPVLPWRGKEFYAQSFLQPTSTAKAVGGVLTDLSDRLPYSAVKSTDSLVWEEFADKNDNLESWAEFGSQLLWLLKNQIVEDVLTEQWKAGPYADWEAECRECSTGEQAMRLLQKVESEGFNWEKVSTMWDREGPGSNGGRLRVSNRRDQGDLSELGVGKRKREQEDSSVSAETIAEFLCLNNHLLTGELELPDCKPEGIGPTLEIIRSQRKTQVQTNSPWIQKTSRQTDSPSHPRDTPTRAERTLQQRGQGDSSTYNKTKGLTCRFCGKAFTHAPAHLQHERAHVQQQEAMNPASRIYQHMPASMIAPRSMHASSPKETVPEPRQTSTARSPSVMAVNSNAVPIRGKQVANSLLDLAAKIPLRASSEQSPSEWEGWAALTARSETLQEVCDQMLWLAGRIEAKFLPGAWTEATMNIWKGECEGCDSGAELMELLARYERDALDWASIDQMVRSGSDVAMLVRPRSAKDESSTNGGGTQGGLPSSCKDCKLRNKGALFCFKRGHMRDLVPAVGSSGTLRGDGTPTQQASGKLDDDDIGGVSSSESGDEVVLR